MTWVAFTSIASPDQSIPSVTEVQSVDSNCVKCLLESSISEANKKTAEVTEVYSRLLYKGSNFVFRI